VVQGAFVIVTTATGGVYHIGLNSKTWSKLDGQPGGEYDKIGPIRVGQPLRLEIITGVVIKVEDDDDVEKK
jgi:hypothetical protein